MSNMFALNILPKADTADNLPHKRSISLDYEGEKPCRNPVGERYQDMLTGLPKFADSHRAARGKRLVKVSPKPSDRIIGTLREPPIVFQALGQVDSAS